MKRVALTAFLLSFSLIFLLSSSAVAQETNNYVAIKAGVYAPTGDLDDADFDSGFNGEVALGHYVMPNLAIELGVGYWLTEASYSETLTDPTLGVTATMREEDEVRVIPVTITAKGVLPADMFELYLGAGIGWYFASFEADASMSVVYMDVPYRGTGTFDDDDNVFGGHVVGGALINITERVFFGVEGKYIWTAEAEASGTAQFAVDGMILQVPMEVESDLNGYTVTGVLGFKF